MTSEYLLDTNIISESMRPAPNQIVIERLRLNQSKICTPTIVIHELLYGCWRLSESNKRRFFEEYIDELIANIPLFDYDLKAARYHARERARLSKIGKTPALIDGQIASVASTNNLILVTNNISDFENFSDLIVENWFVE